MAAPQARSGVYLGGVVGFLVRLEKPVYNVVYRWLWDPQDAREVVQEAFVRLWRMRARVQLGSVEPLVFRIALNLAASKRRWRRTWRFFSLDSGAEPAGQGPGADVRIEDHQRQQAIRAAVEALPEKQREVVMLCELSELSYAQVAEALGIPEGTVASRRHAALERLRRSLGPRMGKEEL